MPNVVTVYHPGGSQFRVPLAQDSFPNAVADTIERDWTYTKDGSAEDLDALHLTPVAGKDDDGVSRYISTDADGKLSVSIIGEDGNGEEITLEDLLTASGLKIVDLEGDSNQILKELKKLNLHMSLMTDVNITNQEVE